MKEDTLEKFVKKNAAEFDSFEPPIGVWSAMEKELPVRKSLPLFKLNSYLWKVAAAMLIFTSAWLLNDYTDHKNSTHDHPNLSSAVNAPAVSELLDAEAFYTTQISNKQVELAQYARNNPEIIEDLKKEFKELDINLMELEQDLAESNADQKVIEAIILSYRVKIEILDQVLLELRQNNTNSSKTTKVETSL